jgi:amino acid transporter
MSNIRVDYAEPGTPTAQSAHPPLERGLGLLQATSLNVANMVGIGPFITIPLFIAAMGGPQAMVGWVVAAVLVLCDGLVWSELGAALPGSGGSYHFLKRIFGAYRWGRIIPFLFIWQFLISGTLELASGYIGMMNYVKYALPGLEPALQRRHVPGGMAALAALTVVLVTALLCRRIRAVGWLAVAMCAGTVITVAAVIVAGLTHFNPSLLRMPDHAFTLNRAWFGGLGGAMLIAIYDYLGYFNVCHLGDEVRDPGRTIPRAVILSVVVVAAVYLTMNLSIIAVVPWQEAMKSQNIAALFMERLFGRRAAVAFTVLVVWTALASLFAGTLGYSRIPFAAAREGDFFPAFALLHPRGHYPWVSLLSLSALTAVFCFFSLDVVISAAVSVRIVVQFIGQIVALHLLRTTRPDVPMPFRMWLYPLPSLVALVGWLFVWATSGRQVLLAGGVVVVAGVAVFFAWRLWVSLWKGTEVGL